MGDMELTLLNFIVKQVEIDLNMFHASVEDRVCTKIGGANIATIYS